MQTDSKIYALEQTQQRVLIFASFANSRIRLPHTSMSLSQLRLLSSFTPKHIVFYFVINISHSHYRFITHYAVKIIRGVNKHCFTFGWMNLQPVMLKPVKDKTRFNKSTEFNVVTSSFAVRHEKMKLFGHHLSTCQE